MQENGDHKLERQPKKKMKSEAREKSQSKNQREKVESTPKSEEAEKREVNSKDENAKNSFALLFFNLVSATCSSSSIYEYH